MVSANVDDTCAILCYLLGLTGSFGKNPKSGLKMCYHVGLSGYLGSYKKITDVVIKSWDIWGLARVRVGILNLGVFETGIFTVRLCWLWQNWIWDFFWNWHVLHSNFLSKNDIIDSCIFGLTWFYSWLN
jgi:hypothetical protein